MLVKGSAYADPILSLHNQIRDDIERIINEHSFFSFLF